MVDVPGRRARRRAMTLVEVTVVLGIIAMLAAIALPAIHGARGHGRSLRCLTNLRQMALAAQQYATTWDRWPVALRYEQRGGVAHRVAWDWVTTFATGEVVSPGAIWSYTDDPQHVMQCPDYHGPSNFQGDPHSGYNYNTSYLGGEAAWVEFGWDVVRRGVAPSACARSTQCAFFGCAGYAGGANKFMRAPGNPEGGSIASTYAGGQAFRHAGDSTNVAYVDGHVAAAHEAHEGAQATPDMLETMGFPENGFLSDDDRAYDPR